MRTPIRLAAAGLLTTVALAACGSDQATTTTSTAAPRATSAPATTGHGSPSPAAAGAGGVDSGAATLRAGLTALLQEHVYLAGIATGTALQGGALEPAAQVLDLNSVALADAIGSVYGKPAGEAFLELWRTHIGFFVDYTTGAATGDQAMQAKAKAGLDQYRSDFGAFLASANPHLTKDAVADLLVPHTQSVFAMIDAQAAKDPTWFGLAREAASHMPMTADALAGAIVTQFPEKF